MADFDIDIDEVNWEIWQKAFDQAQPDIDKQRSPKSRLIPVKGVIRLKADRFRYQNLIWSPWQADLSFKPNTAQLKVIEADLCGISTRADIEIRPPELALQADPAARNEKLQQTLICLFGESYLADGHFNLSGDIKGRAKGVDLMESLGGKLVFKKMYMDSPAMKVTGRGTLDILTREIDFNIIVAPLRTFDRILGIVPLVGGILQTILTVPVKVEGDLKNPKVTLLDPAVVGSKLAEWLQDTIKNPNKLIYPGLK
ncbi:MAG: AsmA-like C-terminal domain-containing protein [Desulfobacterales bacterium]|nr:AsmA-like C-terminal domain-containing protein [Desulfobacterales bacterium]